MPRQLEKFAILIGAVVVGLALVVLLFKSVFFLLRVAIVLALVGGAVLLVKAVSNAWKKSRCDRCSTSLTTTEYTVAMPRERLRGMIRSGHIDAITSLFRPRAADETAEVIARVRTCERCGGTTWLGIYGTDGEILLDEQKRPAP